MAKLVKINKQNLSVKEFKGYRVVTFKDIDTAHGRPDGTAHRNFKSNKFRFVEGIDYFRRNSSEAKSEYGVTAPNGLVLLTESGYLMLAKSFTDDLAWSVQRELVNSYFRNKPEKIVEKKSPEPEQLTIETSEYHYYDKFYNGLPVITIADFAHFTGFAKGSIRDFLVSNCNNGADFFLLVGEPLSQFKRQNPSVKSNIPEIYAITKSGAEKLIKHFNCYDKTPKIFIEEKKNVPENFGIQSRTDFSTEEYIITLEVLNALRLKQKGRLETSFSPEHTKSSIKALCIAMELVATPLSVHVKE